MEKVKLDDFLKFIKDINNNLDNFEKWGLYPNEDPTKVETIKGKKSSTKKDTTGADMK